MKVFLSHQRDDSDLALNISNQLQRNGIETYLDVVDKNLVKDGPQLADHVRTELGKCDHLLAVVSPATVNSWWVPWEIGIATEKDLPLATFAGRYVSIPEYLQKWPYLRNDVDLNKYIHNVKSSGLTLDEASLESRSITGRTTSRTREFYRKLRADLGQ